MKALMQISQLSLQRGSKQILNDVSFAITPGEITVVLGTNGAGKSSLLLALAGLIPAHGTLLLHDTPVKSFSRVELASQIAWQGELPPTEFGLTVHQRLNLADQHGDIDSAAKHMDVAPLLNRALGELSSGERQRVELAALILRDTPIWLLDEPTAHLDLKHQTRCLNMMKEQAINGRAIVTVLHDLQQAAAIAGQVALLDGRGGAEIGATDEMLDIEKLSRLFDTPLIKQGKVLAPDYGEER
ncbi:MAG: ABC transporter ATP-binding protein [Mariprofundus sp.]|nr:ABC transporter ATP-binding protein [Mariprofundus sp.]